MSNPASLIYKIITHASIVVISSLSGLFVVGSTIAQQAQADVPRTYSSTYTSLDFKKCHLITQAELGLPELTEEEMGTMGGQWLCPGYNKSSVYIAESDLRMFVSYGHDAFNERAWGQTLPPFNYVGHTLEWRLRTEQSLASATPEQIPFATILRWHTQGGEMAQEKGEILIVTKLEPGNTCHVAYIDAKLTPNANQIARDFADNEVTGFNCEKDEIFYVPS